MRSLATARSSGTVILMLSRGDSTQTTRPPVRSMSEASSVATTESRFASACAETMSRVRKTCGVCADQ